MGSRPCNALCVPRCGRLPEFGARHAGRPRKTPLIIDVDATRVTAHSEKENTAGTYKGGYDFSPLIAMADYGAGNGTGEVLAILMRPGNKGANSARDHIEVLSRAFAQLPEEFHDEHGGLIGGETPAMTHGSSTRRRSSS